MLDQNNCVQENSLAGDETSQKASDLLTFNQQLVALIKETNKDSLNCFLYQSESMNLVKEYPYEILTAIMSILDSENDEQNKIMEGIYDNVLHFLAINCEPSELLLYLIEQMELSNSDHCFYLLLKPLKICLVRCKNPLTVIDMCIDVLKKFLSSIPTPPLSQQEHARIQDDSLERIIIFHMNFSNFVDNLFNDLESKCSDDSISQNKIKYLLLDLLISVFGKPMCFVNLDYADQQLIFDRILRNIFLIEHDIVHLFRFFDHNNFNYNYGMSSWSRKIEKFHGMNECDLALSNLYWIVFCKQNSKIPCVYNPYYIAYNCICICNYLMSDRSYVLVVKALDMLHFALNTLGDLSIPSMALELSIHVELFKNLENCILYPDSEKTQKYALDNLINYIQRFDSKGRYLVIKNFLISNHHTKIKSVVIGILKNFVVESIAQAKSQCIISNSNEFFLGNNLLALISRICVLDQINLDLVGISDQVIVSLNFILFLILKDDEMLIYFKSKENKFLRAIENALLIQKTEWKLKLDNLENGSVQSNDKDSKISLEDQLPVDQKQNLCNRAINNLYVIENILERIYELMSIKLYENV